MSFLKLPELPAADKLALAAEPDFESVGSAGKGGKGISRGGGGGGGGGLANFELPDPFDAVVEAVADRFIGGVSFNDTGDPRDGTGWGGN